MKLRRLLAILRECCHGAHEAAMMDEVRRIRAELDALPGCQPHGGGTC